MEFFDLIFDGGNEVPQGVLDTIQPVEVMAPEMRNDMEGFEGLDVIVFGNPTAVGDSLDSSQGDNPFNAEGNCGLVSTSNFLNLCGLDANETLITGYAIASHECTYYDFLPSTDNGATNTGNIQNILSSLGVDSEVLHPSDQGGDLESIAAKLEQGYVGMMAVNSGYLWDNPAYVGDGGADHMVTLTGTVRDSDGNLIALTVCDSGSGEPCHVVPIEQLQDCYTYADRSAVVFSTDSLRV